MKKLLAMLLVVAMLLGVLAGCGDKPEENKTPDTYTYNTYTSALATNWNPHTWEMNSDSAVMAYIEAPLADLTVKDSTTGEYQWIFVAATDIKDVTADHQDDLTKYNVNLPEGMTAADIKEDYVFEIKLREEMKWQNGDPINADTYIYSMQQLLDPQMKNYRANNYYSGESALAGAYGYYYQGSPIYDVVVPAYGADETPDYSLDISTVDTYINIQSTGMTIAGYSFYSIANDYGFISAETYNAIDALADADGYVKITDDSKEAVLTAMNEYLSAFGLSIYNEDGSVVEELYKEFLYYDTGDVTAAVEWDSVGLYKVDDYTIRYVCQTAYDYYYFLTSCTSNWIVHEATYEAAKETDAATGLVTSKYNSTVENTMSYGPYKMTVLEDEKTMVFEQNENYWEYTKNEDGTLSSTTFFDVDGAKQPQYLTQKVVIDVLTDDAAKLAFLKGELDDWAPEADDLVVYGTSDRMYKADETYTMSFFFNTNLEHLKEMDNSKGNTNSVVLTNEAFRKAMSLAIDRADLVKATAGYTPAYAIMNNLYYYDVYNNPESQYRKTDAAMEAICKLYGVEYGEGKAYATLTDAYKSINGLNMTEAKNLMKTACEELVEAGLYKAGENIVINVGWAKGALTSADEAQITKLEGYFNEAMKDSGFGTIDLVAVGNITNRYDAVPAGDYAIGWGAWGGAAFYPFRNFQVYCDTEQYSINELGCWDPATENLTLTVDGQEVTMTWQDWSRALIGTGPYAGESNELKLDITAQMEELYLKKYYRIPLMSTTACFMVSYQLDYYTENYNIMYGFGGLELMTYNYTDAEWADFIAESNGVISYE